MIVSCQACSTKFQVPDEKVAGRRARLPCRKCGHPIPIDGRHVRAPTTNVSTPPRLPPRPSPFPGEAREDWKVRFTDQTVTLARAEALALSMEARSDRQSHPEFSEADANMTTPESAANHSEAERVAGVRDFDDGESNTEFNARLAEQLPHRTQTSRPPPPPRRTPDDHLSFQETTGVPPRLPPPPPLPGSRAAAIPAPMPAQALRPFEPPAIPKPAPPPNPQAFPSFGRIQPAASPFAQGAYLASATGGSSYPPPPSSTGPLAARPSSYYPGAVPSTYPPPPADAPFEPTPYLGASTSQPPSNPQFPPSSAPPVFGGFAPVPPGAMSGPGAAAYVFGPAGPFSDRSARYNMSDLTGASRIRGEPPEAASWRRQRKLRSFLLTVIIALAAVSLLLCAVYLTLPDVFYRGVDTLRDQAIKVGLVPKPNLPRPPPGLPFATAQAGQALDHAATLAQSCSRPEGPRGPGRVEVRFHRTGAAKSVELFSPFIGTDVGHCVQKAFSEATVPPYGGTEVIVAKPFTVP